MTVHELIEELKDLPAHYTVFAHNGMGISDPAYVEDWVDHDAERVWISS